MDDARDQLRILLHPSRMLVLALCSAYAGAGACLLSLDLGAGFKALMLALLMLSGYCDLVTRAGAVWRRRVREIVFHADGDWRVIGETGKIRCGRPGAGHLVHPLAVCFTLELAGGKKLPVLIVRDMCTADAFRELRAWLRGHGRSGRDTAPRAWSALTLRPRHGSRS